MNQQDDRPRATQVLARTGRWLRDQGYRFVTPTPLTHARVLARSDDAATGLRDVFGWSRAFDADLLPPSIVRDLLAAGLVEQSGERLASRVRFSVAGENLYAHSAYPTTAADAVFFGPDTYRFIDLVEAQLAAQPLPNGGRILDVCCGAGPGGIAAAACAADASAELVLADINPAALDFARANADLAGTTNVQFTQGDLFHATEGAFDLIISNPPYLVDAAARTYRNGGGELGSDLSERIVLEGLPRLAPGGRLVLYTGVAIVEGVDLFRQRVEAAMAAQKWLFTYRELDPDVFGEELDTPAYAHADRIAAIGLVVQRPA